MYLDKSKSGLTVFVHIMLWLLVGFMLFYPPLTWEINPPLSFWSKQVFNIFILSGAFYLNTLYVAPALFFREQKLPFILWFIAALLFIMALARFIEINLHVREDMQIVMQKKILKSVFSVDMYLLMMTVSVMVISTSLAVMRRWQVDAKTHEMIEKQHITSELALLKAQINPHFFFNTLNNIYALTYSDIPLSREALLKLSRMMRYVLYETLQDTALLSKEISFIKDYIELMKIRLHAHTTLRFTEPELYNEYSVAPMLLLPFIENAFKHGTSSLQKAEIRIDLNVENSTLTLKVENQILESEANQLTKGGIGLANTKRRLNLLYPNRHELLIEENTENRTYSVLLKIEMSELQTKTGNQKLVAHS